MSSSAATAPTLGAWLQLLLLAVPLSSAQTLSQFEQFQNLAKPCPGARKSGVPPSNWTFYHDIDSLSVCAEPVLLDYNLYTDLLTEGAHLTIRACTLGDAASEANFLANDASVGALGLSDLGQVARRSNTSFRNITCGGGTSAENKAAVTISSWQQNDSTPPFSDMPGERDFRPSRLLRLSEGSEVVVLREFEDSANETPVYMTLSHCWGHSMPYRLTTANHSQLLKVGAPLAELGATFQDAVKIALELGVGYLWIDSLCIIQDSTEDWMTQSVQMQQIYSSSFCKTYGDTTNNSWLLLYVEEKQPMSRGSIFDVRLKLERLSQKVVWVIVYMLIQAHC
ncbi:heterokaryon incompatibility protein-domain-containing protein [Microdochium trichocladiopsis]|uniref:Heterokaryon incompatibility protein-domain-containing protein n=1 Tax=Microdochium trichocladiopsis TaxID=1682393 RepID=A0A9P8YI23_9PEZI|nr:heterokaryon incompatibility protein-domain-containing protein [Microdochium trichocladiopsis]KAH7040896.1 heterokaryon incompatibility protein-domain-containing protein [Microdochium trichocladiopsis]